MLGAIAGDVIGSRFEFNNHRSRDFDLFVDHDSVFTDDTVLTIAVAKWLLGDGTLIETVMDVYRRYPYESYGGMFKRWAASGGGEPYNSYGNGSAMRVSPVAHFAADEREVLTLAEKSAAVTHNHPDGIAGAQATALTMWMAVENVDAATIRREITERFDYDLSQDVDEIREWYKFDVSSAGTVPQAITCALEANNYEDAIRNAVSIGGDTDTVACIAGGIAEVLFGMPEEIRTKARTYLPDDMIEVVDQFYVSVAPPVGQRQEP